MPTAIQNVTQQASTTSSLVLGVISGVERLMPLNTLAASYAGTGTGAVTRTFKAKVEETMRSIIDFGGDPTGTSDCTTAFNNAKAAGVRRLYFPEGTYRFNSTILIDRTMFLFGDGRDHTILRSYVTGGNHGMRIIGETALGRSNLIRIADMQLEYAGAGQTVASGGNNNWSGVYIQRKVIFDSFYVRNFTNDGMFFAPSDASEGASSVLGSNGNAVFFAEMRHAWSKDNGRDGIRIRAGANANMFYNCQFDRNGAYGCHHMTDGWATYGNVFLIGQASYNSQYGYYWESGTDQWAAGLYAERNGTPTNTDTNSYQNTPYDFFIGDNTSRSNIMIGTVFGADYSHVRSPARGLNEGCGVFHGGVRIYGSTTYRQATRADSVTNLATGDTLATVISRFNTLLGELRQGNAIT